MMQYQMILCLLTHLSHLIYIRFVSGFDGINITKNQHVTTTKNCVFMCAGVCLYCVYVCVCLSVGVSAFIIKSKVVEKKLL